LSKAEEEVEGDQEQNPRLHQSPLRFLALKSYWTSQRLFCLWTGVTYFSGGHVWCILRLRLSKKLEKETREEIRVVLIFAGAFLLFENKIELYFDNENIVGAILESSLFCSRSFRFSTKTRSGKQSFRLFLGCCFCSLRFTRSLKKRICSRWHWRLLSNCKKREK
jgi:hypothetical protein